MASLQPLLPASPSAFARALLALLRAESATTVVLAGEKGRDPLRAALAGHRDASIAVALLPAAGADAKLAAEFPLLAGKSAQDGGATAYVCRRGTCSAPVHDPAELLKQLG